MVQWLVDNRAETEAKDSWGWNALLWASQRGHLARVSLVLERGANLAASGDGSGYTALMAASLQGHEDVVELLLAHGGIDINAVNRNDDETALFYYCYYGHAEVTKVS